MVWKTSSGQASLAQPAGVWFRPLSPEVLPSALSVIPVSIAKRRQPGFPRQRIGVAGTIPEQDHIRLRTKGCGPLYPPHHAGRESKQYRRPTMRGEVYPCPIPRSPIPSGGATKNDCSANHRSGQTERRGKIAIDRNCFSHGAADPFQEQQSQRQKYCGGQPRKNGSPDCRTGANVAEGIYDSDSEYDATGGDCAAGLSRSITSRDADSQNDK